MTARSKPWIRLESFPGKHVLHSYSLRYALGLWTASGLALFLAFIFQFETPQWAGVSVWIMFMQSPRLNYSKVLFWLAGTFVGAVIATLLVAFFAQTPEIFLLTLTVWLAVCAAAATQLREYRAYGAVLAGYTAAIVSFTAVSNPDLVFEIAVARVSSVTLGIACATLGMITFLPRRFHWNQTLEYLDTYCRQVLQLVISSLCESSAEKEPQSWRHIVERLSAVEHAFDFTLSESADSRKRAAQARSLTATLFCLVAKAQAVELHLLHACDHSPHVLDILSRSREVIQTCCKAHGKYPVVADSEGLPALRKEINEAIEGTRRYPTVSDHFLLGQLREILADFELMMWDQAGLHGEWAAPRTSILSIHCDPMMGVIYAGRVILAMGLATIFWFLTEWPSGESFLLFLAIVCSLLSLLDHAEKLGSAFVKSVAACCMASFFELFFLLQKGEGFLFLGIVLGFFLIPAAYAYTNPKLAGSAVISMLLFYGLVAPTNMMTYDIGVFLNNALAFLAAALIGFFSFHVISSPQPIERRQMLVHAMSNSLKNLDGWGGDLREQRWTSLVFDRVRLLHRFGSEIDRDTVLVQEQFLQVGLQWGLRQINIRKLIERKRKNDDASRIAADLQTSCSLLWQKPDDLTQRIRNAEICLKRVRDDNRQSRLYISGILAELQELSFLLKVRKETR